jgi:ABC-type sulfate transport system permease component
VTARRYARIFSALLYGATVLFVLSVFGLFLANVRLTSPAAAGEMLGSGEFWYSLRLSLVTSLITTLVAVAVGVPGAYALSRFRFFGSGAVDVLLSVPIVLPASTVGLLLLIAFQSGPAMAVQRTAGFQLAYSQPGIVVAQLVIALALGMRAWKSAFDDVDPRCEQVARSLGGSRMRTFFKITLPAARPGLMAGAVLAFSRAMAEFGAVLIFCSAIRGKTDILPVAMFLDVNAGRNERAIAVGFALALLSVLSVWAFRAAGGRRRLW